MQRNLAMTAAMFDVFSNTGGLYATTYLFEGTLNASMLRDPKYILNGVFYYTNTLLTDLVTAGNKVLAKYTVAQSTVPVKGVVVLAGSPALNVVANGRVSWFLTVVRGSSADLNSPGYSYLVCCGSASDNQSDLIVANPNIQLGSVVSVSPRKVRMIGHEQSP